MGAEFQKGAGQSVHCHLGHLGLSHWLPLDSIPTRSLGACPAPRKPQSKASELKFLSPQGIPMTCSKDPQSSGRPPRGFQVSGCQHEPGHLPRLDTTLTCSLSLGHVPSRPEHLRLLLAQTGHSKLHGNHQPLAVMYSRDALLRNPKRLQIAAFPDLSVQPQP